MDVSTITGWSLITIALPGNDTMISLVQSNKIIVYTISMDIRMIALWSVNVIALSQNDTMVSLDMQWKLDNKAWQAYIKMEKHYNELH